MTFDIDANGIVNVSAKDKATGKEQAITITAASGLEEGEVDRLIKEAEAHESEDQKRKEEVETRNRLDTLISQLDRQLEEADLSVDAAPRAAVEQALDKARSTVKSGTREELLAAEQELTTAAHRMAEAAYGSQGPAAEGSQHTGGPQPNAGRPAGGDDGVIDADFEEVQDNP